MSNVMLQSAKTLLNSLAITQKMLEITPVEELLCFAEKFNYLSVVNEYIDTTKHSFVAKFPKTYTESATFEENELHFTYVDGTLTIGKETDIDAVHVELSPVFYRFFVFLLIQNHLLKRNYSNELTKVILQDKIERIGLQSLFSTKSPLSEEEAKQEAAIIAMYGERASGIRMLDASEESFKETYGETREEVNARLDEFVSKLKKSLGEL